jgi:lambda family phage portal protein
MGILSRLLNRSTAPAQVRRFDGAAGGRRGFGMGFFGRVNPEVSAAGFTLRARARYLAANNGLIGNGVANLSAAIAGTGITPAPRHPEVASRAAIMAVWNTWADQADADARTDFYGLQAQITRGLIIDGEAFAILVQTDSGPRVRMLPPEQVDESKTIELASGGYIVSGVEFDNSGLRVAYWIFPSRPTAIHDTYAQSVRVGASDVFHIMQPIAAGQVRGVSWLAPMILPASELDQLCDALLVGVKTAAMFAGFITNANGSGEDPFEGENVPSLEPGALIRLAGGWDVNFSAPQQAQQSAEFLKSQIRQLASGLGVPSHWLDGDLTGANYSSLRAGLLPVRARCEQIQYHTLAPQFLNPIWREVMSWAALAGDLEGFEEALSDFGAEWLPPAWQQVDPAKQVTADIAELEAGLTSRRKLVAQRGWILEDLDSEIAAEKPDGEQKDSKE